MFPALYSYIECPCVFLELECKMLEKQMCLTYMCTHTNTHTYTGLSVVPTSTQPGTEPCLGTMLADQAAQPAVLLMMQRPGEKTEPAFSRYSSITEVKLKSEKNLEAHDQPPEKETLGKKCRAGVESGEL